MQSKYAEIHVFTGTAFIILQVLTKYNFPASSANFNQVTTHMRKK